LLREWLTGQPNRLRDLLSKNAGDFEQYTINNFFDRKELPTPNLTDLRKIDETFESVSLKIPQNIAAQFRALAEAEGKSLQDLCIRMIKEYVDKNYVEYLKNIINSLPQNHKEQVLAELSKGLQ
jgi:hypothetical protein